MPSKPLVKYPPPPLHQNMTHKHQRIAAPLQQEPQKGLNPEAGQSSRRFFANAPDKKEAPRECYRGRSVSSILAPPAALPLPQDPGLRSCGPKAISLEGISCGRSAAETLLRVIGMEKMDGEGHIVYVRLFINGMSK